MQRGLVSQEGGCDNDSPRGSPPMTLEEIDQVEVRDLETPDPTDDNKEKVDPVGKVK